VAGELAAFALLQAANLKETIDVSSMTSLTMEEAGKRMDDAESLVESLLPLIERSIESYEVQTQVAIVSALAQLQAGDSLRFSRSNWPVPHGPGPLDCWC